MKRNSKAFPYIPNALPEVKEAMLKECGVESVDEFYGDIPEELRLKHDLDIPGPLASEYELKRHVDSLLARNASCSEYLNFLGAGCWQHYVPAICDEISGRAEFLTAYAGDPYEDHGRWQAMFEYQSMMGALLNMDVVNVPTYDGSQAAATSLRMACRITGRSQVLVSGIISPPRLAIIRNYCKPDIDVVTVAHVKETGQMNLSDLKAKLSPDTAAVYFENPGFLGVIEVQGDEISEMAHDRGALCVTGVDPISLGVLAPPADYGADIVCGDIQPLGIHMHFGGGLSGFIATRDEERFVLEYPSRLFGITTTSVPGEWGFGDVAFERTSFMGREEGKEYVGTGTALCGITAGVYLALMGPSGMQELGEGIMQRSVYAMKTLTSVAGVKAPALQSAHFKEFVVNLDGASQTVAEINRKLLSKGIFGGKDLSRDFPWLGNSALYCITEVHTKADIDKLAGALQEVVV